MFKGLQLRLRRTCVETSKDQRPRFPLAGSSCQTRSRTSPVQRSNLLNSRLLGSKILGLSFLVPRFFSNIKVWVNCRVIWPHEMFSTIYHRFPEHWAQYIIPSRQRLTEWWRSQQGSDLSSEILGSLCLMFSVISYVTLVGTRAQAPSASLSSSQCSILCRSQAC